MLRVARDGGLVVAHPYPVLDSVLWRSVARAPALREVIAFGGEDGYLAAIDARHAAVRIDLRVGTVTASPDTGLHAITSADGASIYALTPSGEITRFTPSGGEWKFRPSLPASALFAQADGSLIVAGASAKRAIVWRMRPPGLEIVDTLSIDVGGTASANAAMIAATAGSLDDRIYFGANESVIAVRSRDMKKALDIDLGDAIKAIAATPSGDRLFVALDDNRSIRIVDRFEERVSGKVKLPSQPIGLRMDALGRVLLASGAGDSVFVVSLATESLQGTLRSAWRGDLPTVFADGTIALLRGNDVVVAHPETLRDLRTYAGGTRDFWYPMRWNGFRPRAAGLDQPVQFRTSAPRDSADLVDSLGGVVRDSLVAGAGRPASPRGDSAAAAALFTVSFASTQNEKQARDLTSRIRVDGQSPRIITSDRNGTALYRVVMGPFATREAADRVGRASGQSYWIIEGAP